MRCQRSASPIAEREDVLAVFIRMHQLPDDQIDLVVRETRDDLLIHFKILLRRPNCWHGTGSYWNGTQFIHGFLSGSA